MNPFQRWRQRIALAAVGFATLLIGAACSDSDSSTRDGSGGSGVAGTSGASQAAVGEGGGDNAGASASPEAGYAGQSEAGEGGDGGASGDPSGPEAIELRGRLSALEESPFVLVLVGLFDQDNWADFAFEPIAVSDHPSGLLAGESAAIERSVVLLSNGEPDLHFHPSSNEFNFARSPMSVGLVTGANLSEALDFASLTAPTVKGGGKPVTTRVLQGVARCGVLAAETKLAWLAAQEGVKLGLGTVEAGNAALNYILGALGASPVQVLTPGSSDRYANCLRSEQSEFGCIAIETLDALGRIKVAESPFKPGKHCYQVPPPAAGTQCPDPGSRYELCTKQNSGSSGCCNANFIFQNVFRADVSNQAPMPLVPNPVSIPDAPTEFVLDGSGLGDWYDTLPAQNDFTPFLGAPLRCFLGGTDVFESRITRNPVEVTMQASARCAVNTALPGHILQGSVQQCITDDASGTYTQIIGTGASGERFAGLNELLGPEIFSNVADGFKARVGRAIADIESQGKCCSGARIVEKQNGLCPNPTGECASDADCATQECASASKDKRMLCDGTGHCACAETLCQTSSGNAQCGKPSDCSGKCADALGRKRSWYCDDQCACACSAKHRAYSRGDPHFRTFDGLAYDMQAAGEFVALELADVSGGPVIETRHEPLTNDLCPHVTLNTALAAAIGDSVIGIYAHESTPLHIDKIPTTFEAGRTYPLGGGATGRLTGTASWQFTWNDGGTLDVQILPWRGDLHLDVTVAAAPAWSGRTRGLFGNFDGLAKNDTRLRDGTVLEMPFAWSDLYRRFATSYRLAPQESLFEYPVENAQAFHDRPLPSEPTLSAMLPVELAAASEKVCDSVGVSDPELRNACIVDVAM